ncbi:MAG: hypothetical protein WBQ94_21465, partial [Terracidiphilus sp.]
MPATCCRFLVFMVAVCIIRLLPASAQTFSVIHDVDCSTDGCLDQQPIPIAQGRDGNLYGRMYSGGTSG